MTDSFVRVDASNYTRLPRVNARNAHALARAMLVALPKEGPTGVTHAARRMRGDAVTLQDARRRARKAVGDGPKPRTGREVDNEADALHAAIVRRLSDYELLAGHDDDAAADAAALKAALYPSGTDFTRGDMLTQWGETESWFETLGEGSRDKSLRARVGDGFVDALRAVHGEYGEVTGTTKKREATPAKVDVAAPLAALVSSMEDLALQLVALANDSSAPAALRTAARAALRPIDALREGNARRGAKKYTPDPDPADPEEKGEDGTDDELPTV